MGSKEMGLPVRKMVDIRWGYQIMPSLLPLPPHLQPPPLSHMVEQTVAPSLRLTWHHSLSSKHHFHASHLGPLPPLIPVSWPGANEDRTGHSRAVTRRQV
jgi:hypothetical protein